MSTIKLTNEKHSGLAKLLIDKGIEFSYNLESIVIGSNEYLLNDITITYNNYYNVYDIEYTNIEYLELDLVRVNTLDELNEWLELIQLLGL